MNRSGDAVGTRRFGERPTRLPFAGSDQALGGAMSDRTTPLDRAMPDGAPLD
ncbi:hypothetical protein H5411_07880 [Amycolatopsis echigonensis]|uniref:Uncharacterized protein n=1 Tax=Amycolatopsis echigonensis TaxID=2576905 RepID=A0A8E2B0D7_9PSEU|nr:MULTISPECIES: hypothetical protein [Amycolatopsis]MBB2499051.1 hypothetical protein [Amycolatopsis echigonensis]